MLVQRNSEDIPGMGAAHASFRRPSLIQRRCRRGWQGKALSPRACEDGSGAVALVNIAIHRHGSADLVIALQTTDRHRNIVDHAEALAMIGMRVMKSSADADADSVL